MNEKPLVIIQDLSKRFSPNLPFVLKNINAQIPKGQIIGIVGPDGAGKTTLIRLIAGLLLPSQGEILINGKNTILDSEYIHFISGYMPQKFGLYEDLTVLQNLNLYADLRGIIGSERQEAFDKLLKFTSLGPFIDRLAGHLSGGMKQKLGLACALIKKPELLLLDEPSVGIDPRSRKELWTMVTELLKEDISILWSTAYLDEAEKCHGVLLINKGELLFNGKPHELTKKTKDRVYKIKNIENKRSFLEIVSKNPDVIDAVVQGKDIRVVLKNEKVPFNQENLDYEKIKPRFEDAFVDILGGSSKLKPQLKLVKSHEKRDYENPIKVEHLTKKFGSFVAVNAISFTVKKQEIFGLLGPNGAGKSTTFKMLCGLLTPTQGTIKIHGLNLKDSLEKSKEGFGYMAQKFSLYSHLSVMQNLQFFSGIYGLQNKKKEQAIQQMIDIFELSPYLHESSELLPLGYKQRLSLACATMHQPEILFLDEPTSGVDPLTRREFWNHINSLVEGGVTVLVTTHFMDEAEYCDRIGLIYQGEMISIAPPDDLKEEAQSSKNPNPTLEDAFIKKIEEHDEKS